MSISLGFVDGLSWYLTGRPSLPLLWTVMVPSRMTVTTSFALKSSSGFFCPRTSADTQTHVPWMASLSAFCFPLGPVGTGAADAQRAKEENITPSMTVLLIAPRDRQPSVCVFCV